jgi:hypothetical protein
MDMEVEHVWLSSGLEIFNPYEAKIFRLHIYMWHEVIKVIKSFLEFLKSFDAYHVYNMLAIRLNPCLKALCVVENLVGHGNAIRLAF